MSVTVTREPRTYEADSPHSFYRDAATLASDAVLRRDVRDAQQRMHRYSKELAVEIDLRSEEGKRALRVINQAHRSADRQAQERAVREEIRAMSSGSGTGGEFVTPVYLMESWTPALDVEPVLLNQCNNTTLPDYGLKAYLPTFTSGTTATVTSEGSPINIDSPDPVTAFVSANVQTASTAITITQQLSDRGRDVVAFDQALSEQLQLNLNAELDSLVLAGIAATAQTTATIGTASAGALWTDVAGARERAYAVNTRARATHIFTSEKVYGWASKITDNTGRPILEAKHARDLPPWGLTGVRDSDAQWSGFTGTVMPGGVLWFIDQTINNQLLISRPAATVVATAEPVFEVMMASTGAASLELIARSYQYVATLPLIPYANQLVTGYGSVS
jgi:HK97 family phage major capsid protein